MRSSQTILLAGSRTIFCNDGSATHVLGRCGTNCPAGSMRSGTSVIYYPVMDHEDHGGEIGWNGVNGLKGERKGLALKRGPGSLCGKCFGGKLNNDS